jgi:signal transduction histidine kinase
VVYAAEPSDDIPDTMRRVEKELLVGVPLLIIVLAFVMWVVVGRALLPVQAAEDAQRSFVADAAHEFRNPLSALRTQLEVSTGEVSAADRRAQLGEVDRLDRLTDNLLEMARLDGRAPRRHRPVDLDDVVFAEVARIRSGARVPLLTDAVTAARVEGDAVSLARLVRNLLDNAERYAASRVTVSLTAADRVVLVVADDGPGIAAVDRQRVFERFTRLDEARSGDDGGAGLGLAIVRDVVRAHAGTVLLEDNAPGARVVVSLPLAAADVPR